LNDKQSRERKVKALLAMCEMTAGPELSEEGLRMWLHLLKPYSAEDVERAVWACLRKMHFRPAPADIIQEIEGSTKEKSLKAWHVALETLHRLGRYESVRFDDPAIHWAIDRMGGWARFGEWTEEERPFREKQFRELYEAYSGEPVAEYLVGEAEAVNSLNMLHEFILPPVLVSRDGAILGRLNPASEETKALPEYREDVVRKLAEGLASSDEEGAESAESS